MPDVSATTPVRAAAPALRLPRAWAVPLAAFAVSRAVVLLAGLVAQLAWGDDPKWRAFDPGALSRPFGAAGDALVAPFAAWDTVWFLVIANDAYAGDGQREERLPRAVCSPGSTRPPPT